MLLNAPGEYGDGGFRGETSSVIIQSKVNNISIPWIVSVNTSENPAEQNKLLMPAVANCKLEIHRATTGRQQSFMPVDFAITLPTIPAFKDAHHVNATDHVHQEHDQEGKQPE